jgi:hypothetical protein
MGTQRGTVLGESLRAYFKYWQFPTAVIRKTYSRFLYGYGPDTFNSWKSRGFGDAQYDAMAHIGSAMFFGWMALNLKELSNGREPIHFMQAEQRNVANVKRIFDQSGIMGAAGNVMNIFENPASAGGTVGAPLVSLGNDVVEGNFYGATNSGITLTPGNTLPGVNMAIRTVMAGIFSDYYGEAYQSRLDFFDNRFGQSSL